MTELQGFTEYKKEHYEHSSFAALEKTKEETLFLLHGHNSVKGTLARQSTYDLHIEGPDGEMVVPKVEVKAHLPSAFAESAGSLIKTDKQVAAMALGPIHAPAHRFFIKNKTLYPLIRERQVVLITLLEGEVIKGLVDYFSRYDVGVLMKGGVSITILRHAVYDVRDKKGRCYLKAFQKEAMDWKRSELYA